MKCSELKSLLERAIDFRSRPPLSVDQAWARDFFPLLESLPNQTVKILAKAIGGASQKISLELSPVADLCAFLDALASLLNEQAKVSTVEEIRQLESSLRRHTQASLPELVAELSKPKIAKPSKPKQSAAIRDDIVLKYSRRLEEALGDEEGFNAIFAAIESDKELNAAEVAAIAKKFTSATPKSRPAALKKILARHQAIMTSRAKSAATAGRIAG